MQRKSKRVLIIAIAIFVCIGISCCAKNNELDPDIALSIDGEEITQEAFQTTIDLFQTSEEETVRRFVEAHCRNKLIEQYGIAPTKDEYNAYIKQNLGLLNEGIEADSTNLETLKALGYDSVDELLRDEKLIEGYKGAYRLALLREYVQKELAPKTLETIIDEEVQKLYERGKVITNLK